MVMLLQVRAGVGYPTQSAVCIIETISSGVYMFCVTICIFLNRNVFSYY